jgi:hypothetical protein
MTEEAKSWCEERGTLLRLPVADIFVAAQSEVVSSSSEAWENIYGNEFWIRRNGWFKKPLACLLSPYQKSLWIDLDCEVRGSLKHLLDYADHPAGIALAKDHREGYNSGVIVFRHGIPLIETWADESFELNHIYAGDQDILTKIIIDHQLSIADLPTIYNWSRCNGESPDAVIFHWHGRHGKTVIATYLQNL